MKIVDKESITSNKSKRRIIIIAILVLIIATPIVSVVRNPVMRPASWTRASLLRDMPIGTHIDEVVDLIESNYEWNILLMLERHGFIVLENDRPTMFANLSDPNDPRIVGNQSIRLHLGDYFILLFGVAVEAYLAFDADGYLIEIAIWKDVNSI